MPISAGRPGRKLALSRVRSGSEHQRIGAGVAAHLSRPMSRPLAAVGYGRGPAWRCGVSSPTNPGWSACRATPSGGHGTRGGPPCEKNSLEHAASLRHLCQASIGRPQSRTALWAHITHQTGNVVSTARATRECVMSTPEDPVVTELTQCPTSLPERRSHGQSSAWFCGVARATTSARQFCGTSSWDSSSRTRRGYLDRGRSPDRYTSFGRIHQFQRRPLRSRRDGPTGVLSASDLPTAGRSTNRAVKQVVAWTYANRSATIAGVLPWPSSSPQTHRTE